MIEMPVNLDKAPLAKLLSASGPISELVIAPSLVATSNTTTASPTTEESTIISDLYTSLQFNAELDAEIQQPALLKVGIAKFSD